VRAQVFVDTGAWIATAVKADRLHRPAAAALRQLIRERSLLVTTEYVLSETLTRLRYDSGHRAAVDFLAGFDHSMQAGAVLLLRLDDEDLTVARKIFIDYTDQEFSFVDCTSFALARRLKIQTAFAFDRHFATMGFTPIPA